MRNYFEKFLVAPDSCRCGAQAGSLCYRSFHAWWVGLLPMRNYLERFPARLSPPRPCPFFSNGIDN